MPGDGTIASYKRGVTGRTQLRPPVSQLARRSSREKIIGMLVLAEVEATRRGNTMLIMKHGHMVRYAPR